VSVPTSPDPTNTTSTTTQSPPEAHAPRSGSSCLLPLKPETGPPISKCGMPKRGPCRRRFNTRISPRSGAAYHDTTQLQSGPLREVCLIGLPVCPAPPDYEAENAGNRWVVETVRAVPAHSQPRLTRRSNVLSNVVSTMARGVGARVRLLLGFAQLGGLSPLEPPVDLVGVWVSPLAHPVLETR
jgi:hypothetical protein